MPEQRRVKGIPASPGYAAGALFPLDRPDGEYLAHGEPEAEAIALRGAIARAATRIANLVEKASGDSAAILEFQLAMLEDQALTAPAFAAIAEGATAYDAWVDAIDSEIVGYEVADDEYFRARAADLKDIRRQVLTALVDGDEEAVPQGAILFGEDITPTRFLETDWSHGGGIALKGGSTASHVAMLARSHGVPMVVGLGDIGSAPEGMALLDAEHGNFVIGPGPDEIESFRLAAHGFAERRARAADFLTRAAVTRNGEAIRVLVNVADPSDIETIDIGSCDGVGLMRTEFLFGKGHGLPDEETQYAAYRKVLEWARGKPVTIRTVDAGGDKPVPGFTVEESNPFLGLRGIRLSLARPEVFRVQIRALLRAAVHGNLKVMFPMIAVADEYGRAVALFEEEAAKLAGEGKQHRMPPLGIMVEVPAVALALEGFLKAAFFSIGSNDLTQYVMAAARDNASVAHLNVATNTAVLRLIGLVAKFGGNHNIPVSLCGDAASDPASIPALLKAGLRDLSVVPAQLAMAKAAIADVAV
jgi:phosphoenolpyruvate-protein phosphotransferase (PTS system enzyme I)